MTVTWMVTPTRLILVIVDTLDTQKRCQNPNNDSYVDGDPTRLIIAGDWGWRNPPFRKLRTCIFFVQI